MIAQWFFFHGLVWKSWPVDCSEWIFWNPLPFKNIAYVGSLRKFFFAFSCGSKFSSETHIDAHAWPTLACTLYRQSPTCVCVSLGGSLTQAKIFLVDFIVFRGQPWVIMDPKSKKTQKKRRISWVDWGLVDQGKKIGAPNSYKLTGCSVGFEYYYRF